jgi:predicted dinucleotide-utilizing enzyme
MIKEVIDIIKIWHWHKKTFPKFKAESQKLKLRGEIDEFIDEFEKFTKSTSTKAHYYHQRAEEELTDVIIASINAMRFEDVRKAVNKKMKINHKRSWENGQHKH